MPKQRERATELEYFRWFRENADFGPNHANYVYELNLGFMDETGENLPEGWNSHPDGENNLDR